MSIVTDNIADIRQVDAKANSANPVITGSITEEVSVCTLALDASNGTVQTITMTQDEAFTDGLSDGQSMLLRISTGGFTPLGVLDTDSNWINGVKPTYTTTDDIIAYKLGGVLTLAYVGSVVS